MLQYKLVSIIVVIGHQPPGSGTLWPSHIGHSGIARYCHKDVGYHDYIGKPNTCPCSYS